jgi:adiponectin receptor
MALCCGHHVPEYLQNAFISAGYRVEYNWKACLKSVFSLHNETLNVWTHFIGFLIFAALTVQLFSYTHTQAIIDFPNQFYSTPLSAALGSVNYNLTDLQHPWEFEKFAHSKIVEMKGYISTVKGQIQDGMDSMHSRMDTYFKEIEKSVHELQNFHPHFPELNFQHNLRKMNAQLTDGYNKYVAPRSKWPMIVFLISGMICFMGSTLFHTFGCQSRRVFYFFLKVDYSGIAVLIAGSIVPFICYIFHELTQWQYIYLTLLSMVSVAVVYVSFVDRFSADEYQPYRAALFVLMACFFVVPFGHMLWVYGNIDKYTLGLFLLSMMLYAMGVGLYVLRFPERVSPGKFDIWLHSHQVFHMFIVAAAIAWYYFMKRLWENIHSHEPIFY